MKTFYFLIPLFMIGSCNAPKGKVTSSEKTAMDQIEIIKSNCPKDGTCELVINKNKKLEMVDDGEGQIYSEVLDGENIVVEYTYLRKGSEGTADGNYFETIQFEIPADTKNLAKENAALAEVKLVFGKHAYRNAGYYQITNGKLSVQKTDNKISFNLTFKVEGTSQVVSQISESAKI